MCPEPLNSNRRRQNRTLRRQHLSAHEGEESVRSSLRQAHHRRSGFEFRNQRRIALREQKESHEPPRGFGGNRIRSIETLWAAAAPWHTECSAITAIYLDITGCIERSASESNHLRGQE